MNTQLLAGGVGQACRIALPSRPGSGATWYVDAPSAALQVTLERTEESGIRRGGSQVFLVVGEMPGEYELRFVLRRAWERQERGSKRVLVQVRGASARRPGN